MPSGSSPLSIIAGVPNDVRYGRVPPVDGVYRRAVIGDDAGGAVVRGVLDAGEPCLIGRLGYTELACVSYFTRWRSGSVVRLPYPARARRDIRLLSGMFPVDPPSLDRFSEAYLDAVTETDVMGVWFNRNEHRIVGDYCPGARLVHLEALNSVLAKDPWSAALEGRTVLVIHPFARTIASQYATRRALLFADPRVLRDFELKTLPAVQSIAGNECGYATWFDALESMKDQIAAIEFDVAIIGAGAYGLPLAAAVKRLGRQAVHLGGATQLLFGILGRRWEGEYGDVMAPLFNEWWVRPAADETPGGSDQVEGGCYW